MINSRNDLTGKIFGNFLVLNQAEDYISPKGCHRSQWVCKCLLCGKENIIIMDSVLKKQTKESCGCLKDLTNKRFGRLVVIGKIGKNKKNNTVWHCKCDCDNEIFVEHNRLTSGNVKSCGCFRKDLAKEKFSKYNIYDLYGDYGIGYTTNTNQPFYFDLEDYDLIKNYTWYEDISIDGYHSLKSKDVKSGKIIKMSYLIGCKYFDHKNRNPLDNRRKNLRPATNSQNAQNRTLSRLNTSGFTGVSWDKEFNKWVAYIKLENKMKKLGRFIDKEEAIKVRLEAEAKHFKEFAPQRHLFKQYGILEDEFIE